MEWETLFENVRKGDQPERMTVKQLGIFSADVGV